MATASAVPTANAAERVFAIPELLEQILLQVLEAGEVEIDNTDDTLREARIKLHAIGKALACVYASQGVNKSFLNTIRGSQMLMQALWMLPDQPPPCTTTPESRLGRVNPMFIRATTRTPRRAAGRANPGLFLDFFPNTEDLHPNDFCIVLSDYLRLEEKKDGSWKNVLLFYSTTGPQTCGLSIVNRWDSPDFWASFWCPQATTAGDFVRQAGKTMKATYSRSFGDK